MLKVDGWIGLGMSISGWGKVEIFGRERSVLPVVRMVPPWSSVLLLLHTPGPCGEKLLSGKNGSQIQCSNAAPDYSKLIVFRHIETWRGSTTGAAGTEVATSKKIILFAGGKPNSVSGGGG